MRHEDKKYALERYEALILLIQQYQGNRACATEVDSDNLYFMIETHGDNWLRLTNFLNVLTEIEPYRFDLDDNIKGASNPALRERIASFDRDIRARILRYAMTHHDALLRFRMGLDLTKCITLEVHTSLFSYKEVFAF